MKAKAYLKKIETMDVSINMMLEELESLKALSMKITATNGGERVQSSGSQQKMADCVTKIVDMQEKINKDIDSFVAFKSEALSIINNNCDPDCATLIYKKYFQYKGWHEIAKEMNFTYKWVSCGLHQRALTQVQKGLDTKEGVKDGND